MDFIERLFGIAPDGGSGILETCLVLVPFGILALLYIGRKHFLQHRRR